MASLVAYLTQEGYTILEKANKLNDKDSKNDPEDNPYKSKYAARELYQNVKNKVESCSNEDLDDDIAIKFEMIKSAISLKLAINYEETEEMSTSEELLLKCLKENEEDNMRNERVNLYQATLNQLAILWSNRRESEKALKYLQQAENVYKTFKLQKGDSPYAWTEWLEAMENDEEKSLGKRVSHFESTYTHTLYYCAQVYTQLQEQRKAAKYCHVTLQRQLNSMKYDAIDWALNAATLSQYYLSENMSLSRHCLAAASYIFNEAPNESEIGNDKDLYNQKKADIKRCWIKYALQLMDASKNYLCEDLAGVDLGSDTSEIANIFSSGKEEECSDNGDTNPLDDFDIENISQKHLRFDLELTVYEEKVTDKPLLVFDDARKVFLEIQEWIKSATKDYYTMDDHCSDYIQLIQDHSTAYKHLAFFEMDLDRQCKMHKKRIDMLLDINNIINPQHYLLIKRQLIFEVAETYQAMADLKSAKLEPDGNSRSPHAVNKINQLTQHGIDQFEAYLETLKDLKTSQLPEKLGESDVRPALVAKFCIGRLFSKLIMPGLEEKLSNMLQSMNNYKFLVEYCQRNEDDKARVQSEYNVCVEMVELLPLRMERLRQIHGQ